MGKFTGTHHTCYTVSDMECSLAFYRDLLGFEVYSERPAVTNTYFRTIVGFPDAVVYAVLLKIPGSEHALELLQYKHPKGVKQDMTPNNPGSGHVAYMVDDLKSIYERLQEAGIEFITPPVYLDEGPSRGGWALYMKDPDGIIVELCQVSE